ncbi:MAG: hypothetical protein JXA69_16430 [Phycisphaerae bacterium]|nr:hypothetical protein [Phycisphaerae bacterium]
MSQQAPRAREEVSRLRGEIQSQEAAAEALAGTPVKGVDFEDEVRATVQCWGRMVGAAVDQVGPDRKPGDVLVTLDHELLSTGGLKIVIEARDESSPRGKRRIADAMDKAMRARGAGYGIYIAKTSAGLAREVTEWSEGRCSQGPYLATTSNNLLTALRFAVVDGRKKNTTGGIWHLTASGLSTILIVEIGVDRSAKRYSRVRVSSHGSQDPIR